MELTLIRNATMKLLYGGLMLLTDPMLSRKGEIESFAGIASNPTVDLPFPVDQILSGINGVLASHIHQDHFDKVAFASIPKDTPIYCQPEDEKKFRDGGFIQVTPIDEQISLNGIHIRRTMGKHGYGKWEKKLGAVSGFLLNSREEPCLYWAGDTVWCDEVKHTIDEYRPDIIIVHGCGAKLPGSDHIVMDDRQVVRVCRYSSESKVIAVHMEALDHSTVNRNQLRDLAINCGITEANLSIPEDGQTIRLL